MFVNDLFQQGFLSKGAILSVFLWEPSSLRIPVKGLSPYVFLWGMRGAVSNSSMLFFVAHDVSWEALQLIKCIYDFGGFVFSWGSFRQSIGDAFVIYCYDYKKYSVNRIPC